MSEHAKELEPKIRKVQDHIARMAQENQAALLPPIIHRPGWTTLPEVLFVHAMLDSLTRQLEEVDRTHRALVSIADKIGRSDDATKAA
jgi:hypothetical protein